MSSSVLAQQPLWRPTRLPDNSSARPLQTPASHGSALPPKSVSATSGDQEHLGSGVVLRWKSPATRQPANPPASANPSGVTAQTAFHNNRGGPTQPNRSQANPLRHVSGHRDAGRVRMAAYQQDPNDPFADPFGDRSNPQATPQNAAPPNAPSGFPGLPNAPTPDLQDTQPPLNDLPPATLPQLPQTQDPLQSPEVAPGPGGAQETPPTSPFPGASQDPSASDGQQAEMAPVPGDAGLSQPGEQDDTLDLPNRRQNDSNFLSCDEFRDRVGNNPLAQISLDVSPNYGEGLRSVKKDTEQERQQFAAQSVVRPWSDYTGRLVATGRLVDLRDDRVILDVDGVERAIPLYDLSDVDVAYVGESWNIPLKCGTGNASYAGRNFVPSAVQWKAPGHSHKPLYFENTQLERYGHEVGPVLQPLISTAHFFGNIAVLPYKMGIHPPNECQYSLGYYRPGNCAPYMLPPIPWSLRGAAAQAGFVTGAAGLIP